MEKYLSEITFTDRKLTALQQRSNSACRKLPPLVAQYHPSLPSLRKILMGEQRQTQNQQRLREIFKPLLISYRKRPLVKQSFEGQTTSFTNSRSRLCPSLFFTILEERFNFNFPPSSLTKALVGSTKKRAIAREKSKFVCCPNHTLNIRSRKKTQTTSIEKPCT